MLFMKSATVFHWRLFRTYTSLLQVGYKLYYRQTVAQLRVNKDKYVYLSQLFPLFRLTPYRCNLLYTNTGITPKDVAFHYAFILRD